MRAVGVEAAAIHAAAGEQPGDEQSHCGDGAGQCGESDAEAAHSLPAGFDESSAHLSLQTFRVAQDPRWRERHHQVRPLLQLLLSRSSLRSFVSRAYCIAYSRALDRTLLLDSNVQYCTVL